MKNWIEKIKNAWKKLKTFSTEKVWPWIKKSWGQAVNLFVLFVAYSKLDDYVVAETVVSLWIFFLLGYYIFWKLLGLGKMIKK